ncbi:MAG: c-type cytochrome, partial [Gammaproteobacteria bacterium]|nr:c-type cytochrome [Gammaproteobacteria bacterium]
MSYRVVIYCLLAIYSPLSANASVGEKLYNRYCAACHGSEGNGGVGVPLALPAFQQAVDDD